MWKKVEWDLSRIDWIVNFLIVKRVSLLLIKMASFSNLLLFAIIFVNFVKCKSVN